MREFIEALIAVLVVWVILVVIAVLFGSARCSGQFPDMSPQFSIVTECTIMVNGKRIPASTYRVIE